MTNTQLLMDLKDVDNTDLLCNTPFFIYSADTEARTVTKFTSTMDIAPTVANLFDLDVNYAYYIGDDIFGDGGGYVIFKGNNWYDGEIYYTPNYTGELTEEIQARNAEISRRVNAAWDTLRSNYFAHPEQSGCGTKRTPPPGKRASCRGGGAFLDKCISPEWPSGQPPGW